MRKFWRRLTGKSAITRSTVATTHEAWDADSNKWVPQQRSITDTFLEITP